MRITRTFLFVALIGVLITVACGGGSPTSAVEPTQAPVSTVAPTAAPATTIPVPPTTDPADPTVEPAVQPTVAPTPDPEPTQVTASAVSELTLELLVPEELEIITEESRIELVGSTRVDAVVTINDTVVEPDADGLFSLTIDLEEGPNLIEIIASIASGEQKDLVLVVIYIP